MKRTPMPRRKSRLERRTELRASSRRAGRVDRVRRVGRRSTGPTRRQREVVWQRAGFRCEVCGTSGRSDGAWSIHHRQPRGMGGSRAESNTPDRLLLCCGSGNSGCHGLIESNRAEAYANGWLVRRPTDPVDVPVVLHIGPVLLTRDGGYVHVGRAA